MDIVHVKLLDEGTLVFKPVPASGINETTYKLEGWDLYDPTDECWEFPPGSLVLIKNQLLGNRMVRVAISLLI